jgi:hypothetical protein
MAHQVFGSKDSARRFNLTPGGIKLVVLSALLVLAAVVSQGQKPAAEPRLTPPTAVNPVNPNLPQPTPPLAFRLDHFLCYVVEPVQFQPKPGLSLIDQFNPKPRPFVLTERQLLCNPVSKNGEVIHNPRGHLTGYVMKEETPPAPNTPVVVINQFGKQGFIVLQQSRFLVPTGKLVPGQPATTVPPPPPIPQGLDHYACYTVRPEGNPPHPGVVLSDQFGRLQGEVVQPMFLCNPAEKLMDNRPTGHILNPRDHLMCYVIKAGGFQPHKAQIHNQFETTVVEAVRPELLCLPSTKQVLKLGIPPGAVK